MNQVYEPEWVTVAERKPEAQIHLKMQLTGIPGEENANIFRKLVLLVLALICKVVATIQLRTHMQAGALRTSAGSQADSDSPAVWPPHHRTPVYMVFEEKSVHYGLDTPVSDAEWSSLAPDDGLIYLGEEHQVFSISMFHELRCLNIIRQGILEFMDGNATISTALVQHCMNYIRQMIFCRSNTMLNGFVKSRDGNHETTLLGTHQCNDWTGIYKELEKNQNLLECRSMTRDVD